MPNGKFITLVEGSKLTAAFRETYPGQSKAVMFDAGFIKTILDQDGCEGLRIYYGVDEDSNLTTVLVGVKGNGDDMLDCIVDEGTRCPTNCSTPNDLNPA